MIECGVGLVVICLPPLRSVYGKISPGSIINGIRSALAGRSIQSHTRTEAGIHHLNSLDRSAQSSTSRSNLRPQNEGAVQTYVVGAYDLEVQDQLPKAGIQIKNDVEQY